MSDLPQILRIADVIILPFAAFSILILSKVCVGAMARWAERQFYAVLVVMTLVTLRTVVRCDEAWLVHMLTLGVLITGSLTVRPQNSPVAT